MQHGHSKQQERENRKREHEVEERLQNSINTRCSSDLQQWRGIALHQLPFCFADTGRIQESQFRRYGKVGTVVLFRNLL